MTETTIRGFSDTSLVLVLSAYAYQEAFSLVPAYRVLERGEFAALGHSLAKNEEFDRRVKLFTPDAPGATTVMIGDSLTAYADWNFLLKRSDVLNYGIPADTSSGLLQRVTDAHIEGKTVFIMIGVNSLSHHFPVEVVADDIRRSVEILARKNKVYLQTTLLTKSPSLNDQIKLLDAIESYICAEHGECTLIDLNPVLAPHGALADDASIDDVHVNPAAYVKWAQAVSPYLPR